MTMPVDLVLVRHGESEGNIANKLSRQGDNSCFTPDFRERIGACWRLTNKGREQAKITGEWIRNSGLRFDRYYVSEYIRALETAGHLELPDAEWLVDFYLRERDWGDMEVLPDDKRREKFAQSLRRRQQDSFYWTPPNGESLAQLCLRIDRVIDTLHRECSDKRVLVVCHGEVMWGFRVRLERMSQTKFRELDLSTDPRDRIHNCQVLHYTRCNPDSGELLPYLSWVRSVNPFDPTLSSNEWRAIQRQRYTNSDLLNRVAIVPQIISA